MQPSSSCQYQNFPPMPVSGIQGQVLEVTVVGCNKLKDTEWISRQDPYVCLEYGSTKFRTRTCTDGGKNPTFQEKFVFKLIEGLQEFNAVVWNSNTLTFDNYIGNGKIQLQKVLSHGYDDSAWSLQTKTGRYAGEVRLIMHYSNAPNKMMASYTPSPPPPQYMIPHVSLYASPPPGAGGPYYPAAAYPNPSPYPNAYLTNPAPYPPTAYHLQPSAYSSQPYPPTPYPPQPYPPPPQPTSYYTPCPYIGSYPPPPPY